jgi:hypothetical protein
MTKAQKEIRGLREEIDILKQTACENADVAGYYGDDPVSANQCFVQKISELRAREWNLMRLLNCGSLDAIPDAVAALVAKAGRA